MRSRVFACLFLTACLTYPQQPASVEPQDLCRIEGRTVHSVTGAPVRRVNLTLTMASREPINRAAVSDADGRFVFEGLAPGTYMLRAQRTGFVQQAYTGTAAVPSGQLLRLSAGQVVRDILFKLVPQGVIAGKVVDDEGEPVLRAQVRAITAPGTRGRSGMASSSTNTNDLGEYRLAELAPGRYLVMAVPMRTMSSYPGIPANQGGPSDAPLPTYYPAAADPASATLLEVGPGQEVPGIAIRLRRGSVYRVQGTVIATSQDEVLSRIFLQLSPRQASSPIALMTMSGSGGMVRPDGSFVIAGVEPGAYNLTAMRAGGPNAVVGRMPVTVGNSDVSGLVLTLREPLRVEGAIRVEGPRKADFTRSRITLRSLEGLPVNTPNAAIDADHKFTLENVSPDSYLVTISPLPPGAYLKSVRAGNRESPAGVLDLSEAQTGTTVDILVSPNGATVAGAVSGLESPVSRAYLVLVPDPVGPGSMWRMMMRTTQNGKFSFAGVAPGNYGLYAFDEMLVTQNDDPSVLKPYESKVVKLTVGESEQKQVDVTVLKTSEAK